jgi:fibronectin-binding autotransporter adhesin
LSSGNTYTGGTIITAGTLAIADDTSVNSITPTFNTSGVGFLQFLSSTSNLTFTSGTSNLSVPTGSTTTLLQPVTGTAGIYFAGPGKLVLTPTTTTSGTINVAGGVLNFADALGTGTVFVGNDATLQFATGNTTDITAGRTLLIGAGGMTIDTNGNNVTFNSTFGGSLRGPTPTPTSAIL